MIHRAAVRRKARRPCSEEYINRLTNKIRPIPNVIIPKYLDKRALNKNRQISDYAFFFFFRKNRTSTMASMASSARTRITSMVTNSFVMGSMPVCRSSIV